MSKTQKSDPEIEQSPNVPRPDGYFASDYAAMDEERIALEEAMSKLPQQLER